MVRAEWLRWLCIDPKASAKVTPRGIEIAGARIEGKVDLAWANIQFPLRTFQCAFTDDIILDRATVGSLQLQSTCIQNLSADNLTVEKDISFADGFRAVGQVWLRYATINGTLDCDNGHFVNPGKIAFNLEAARTRSVFMRNGFEAEGQVDLYAAVISGSLECGGGRFINPGATALNLDGVTSGELILSNDFAAEGEVNVSYATISNVVDCDNGHFINPGKIALDFEGTKTGSVFMRDGFEAVGEVKFYTAVINGTLQCDRGRFTNTGATALNLEATTSNEILLWNDFAAEGEVNVSNATISNGVDCDNGRFINPGRIALDLAGTKTGSVFMQKGFRAQGEVNLVNAAVNGSLICSGGYFSNPNGWAINATAAYIQDAVLLDSGFEAEGQVTFQSSKTDQAFRLREVVWHEDASLDLRSAKTKTLLNDQKGWPRQDHLLLYGFTYDEIDAEAGLTAKTQLAWIQRQPRSHFIAQPYEQAAAVLRNMGFQEEAVIVMIAKNQDHGRHSNGFKEVIWYNFFGPFIGFGYHPWNAFYASLAVILVGYVLFQAGKGSGIVTPTKIEAYDKKNHLSELYPKFNAFIYSLETFIPLLKLGVAEGWMPNANRGQRLRFLSKITLPLVKLALHYRRRGAALRLARLATPKVGGLLRCYLWCHIILGWILTTLWVGGLTGLLKT